MRSLKNFLKWLVLLILLLLLFICVRQTLSALPFSSYECCIFVDLKELRLILKNANQNEIIGTFPIAGPASINYLRPLPKIGEVTRVVFNPTWRPTENIKNNYRRKYGINLPDVIPPGHPLNAMGKVAIILSFDHKESIYRIHGTNDSNSIGKYISSGCIRMRNEDVEKLAKIILNKKTKVIIYEKIPVE